MASGPFFQQITVVRSTDVVVGQTSTYARVDFPIRKTLLPNITNPLSSSDVPDAVLTSIYRGVYRDLDLDSQQTDAKLRNQPPCSTGNCTFDEFHRLAVCSACDDITDLLGPPTRMTEAVSWALPNNFTAPAADRSALAMMTSGSFHSLRLRTGLPIVNITAIQPCVGHDLSPCAATAQECMLHWRLNKYRSKIVNSIFQEEILENITYGYAFDHEYMFSGDFQDPQAFLVDNFTSNTYTVSCRSSLGIAAKVADLLTVNVTTNSSVGTDVYLYTPKVPAAFPDVPLDMPPFFEAMAVSITSAIRSGTADSPGLRTVPGKATTQMPYLRVRWAWICLPAMLQLVVLLLLCYTATSTSHQKLPIWKNSTLATMIAGARSHYDLPAEVASNRLADIKAATADTKIRRDQISVDQT